MSGSTSSPPSAALSRAQNRQRAMAAVQGIFERYHLVQAHSGRPAFDNAVMQNAIILDASSGPPYDVPQPLPVLEEVAFAPAHLAPGDASTTATTASSPTSHVSETRTSTQPPQQQQQGEADRKDAAAAAAATTTATEPPYIPASPPNTGIVASCTSKLAIGPELANYNGVMHGGAAGVIFDMLTTIALGPVARPGFWSFLGGVTRTLNISYLKAVPIGTTIIVHAYVYQVGRTTAYIKGWMTSHDGRTTYAVCDHHKIHVPTPQEHMALKVAWDDAWDEKGLWKSLGKGKL
ncbi:HotDog domain-containing protein [Coniella lustricola]|uniref:HotDog domain-containing protein n=1 Tax=Coniella lustricola TaxID=2025994 RepID=A0A2T2ZW40_9PEZI|nr:HotDog domain-containing protein [Coniella lustricola]